MEKVKVKSYTLRTEDGHWLGQVVLTSDGMFSSVTDYGNLGFAWRSFGKGGFREFILDLNEGYFGTKMFNGIAYIAHSRKIERACDRFAEKILPPLKEVIIQDLKEDPHWID